MYLDFPCMSRMFCTSYFPWIKEKIHPGKYMKESSEVVCCCVGYRQPGESWPICHACACIAGDIAS